MNSESKDTALHKGIATAGILGTVGACGWGMYLAVKFWQKNGDRKEKENNRSKALGVFLGSALAGLGILKYANFSNK